MQDISKLGLPGPPRPALCPARPSSLSGRHLHLTRSRPPAKLESVSSPPIRKLKVVKRGDKKLAHKRAVSPRPVVEIDRPTSPEASERAFGISPRRARDIQRLVDEALG